MYSSKEQSIATLILQLESTMRFFFRLFLDGPMSSPFSRKSASLFFLFSFSSLLKTSNFYTSFG
jgi:hypothetical protein